MSYRQALEEIATGYIVGEKTNYKNTVDVMRSIAKEALETSQTKPLSDEEIDSLIAEYKIGEFNGFYVDKAMTESMQRRYKNVLDFARAILKKASEK